MTSLSEIFRLRFQLDVSRQPPHKAKLERLPVLLEEIRQSHPYELSASEETTVLSELGCMRGPAGESARPPGSDHLYRLTSLGGVMLTLGWEGLVPNLHAALTLAYADTHDWLSLSNYGEGSIANERGFSWWTPLNTLLEQPYRSGHHLGLVDQWIAVHSLVLRCAVADITSQNLACVPTITDGLCSPVFAAPKTSEAPSAGVTIDLRGTGPVRLGAPEYALRAVPVELIEFIPIRIPDDARMPPRVPKGAATWQRLLPFYEGLANE